MPEWSWVQGICKCGHTGLQRRPDMCGDCAWAKRRSERRAATPKPDKPAPKVIQGACACGHAGRQKRKDICGACFKEMKKLGIL